MASQLCCALQAAEATQCTCRKPLRLQENRPKEGAARIQCKVNLHQLLPALLVLVSCTFQRTLGQSFGMCSFEVQAGVIVVMHAPRQVFSTAGWSSSADRRLAGVLHRKHRTVQQGSAGLACHAQACSYDASQPSLLTVIILSTKPHLSSSQSGLC